MIKFTDNRAMSPDVKHPLVPEKTVSLALLAARKDDAPAADHAAITKGAGSMAFSGGGGLIQATDG